MLKLLTIPMRNILGTFHADEKAQDAFEYLLVVGGVSVAIVVLIAAGAPSLATLVIDWVTDQINGITTP
ncbi:MAG: hypothetical protein M0R74_01530 [Dehalococcoidia bacterium]|nr:hypothetical protein [Dehalococcoidia bacterium]